MRRKSNDGSTYRMAHGAFAPRNFGLLWLGNLGNWIGTVFVVAIAGYFVYSAYTLLHNASEREKFRDASQNHDWMMPVNISELRWFTLGLSVSAGVCEELLFRGFIIGLVLGVIFILTESLWVVVALHALVDIYGGIVGHVLPKPEEQMVE